MKIAFLPGLIALALTLPAGAETQEDVLSARILPGWQMPEGGHMAAISLTLAPGWKTYWRAPGEAGIPPLFDWSGSENLAGVVFHWPSPSVISLNGMNSIGYLDALDLPMEVTAVDPALPVVLRVHMQLGVCHDICMPAAVDLAVDLAGPGAPDAAIAAALEAGPVTAETAGLAAITCQLTPIADGLRIAATLTLPSQGRDEAVVFETAAPGIWVSEAQTSRDGLALTAEADLVPAAGAPFALDRAGVVVTVLSEGRSVEIHGCPAP
jgi:DsbC/DsbD-like thiol-disulfide interchange protein